LITGASRGIGKAIAFTFASEIAETHNIIITYINNNEEANNVCEIIKLLGHNCYCVKLDVRDRINIDVFIKHINSIFGNIDVLINNAGITKDRTISKMTDEEWDDVIAVNLTGVYNMTKAIIPIMNDGGNIITISSVIGIVGAFGQSNYSASKAGVIGFTKSIAKELAKRKIRVNCIAGGFTNTDMTAKVPNDVIEKIISKIPLNRLATPIEIAKMVKWLVEDGTYCTGQVFTVDGGLT
jgi:3-oxoacyl-[acyl-carrier protein] reductase